MAEIIRSLTEDVKEFNTTTDFNKYYELNKTEMDKLSTCALNKKYKITGYHLGRKKGELKLIPLNLYRPSEYEIHQQDTTLNDKIDILNKKIDMIINILNSFWYMEKFDNEIYKLYDTLYEGKVPLLTKYFTQKKEKK